MTTRSDIEPLLLQVAPIDSQTTVDQTADLFLDPRYERLLSIPVVDPAGTPIGAVSRFQLNQIFLRRYGRELYGRYHVQQILTDAPLVVDATWSLERAAEHVTSRITGPLREDFVITRAGRYLGMGVVLDLLRAMQARVAQAFAQLQKSQAQLVQSEKMASLGQMVAGVAHEINTPLGYVRNNVEILAGLLQQARAAVDDAEKLVELLSNGSDERAIGDQLLRADRTLGNLREGGSLAEVDALSRDTLFGVDQIRDLVVNLRNFTRLDQQRLADVSVGDCLEQTLTIAQHVLKNKAQVVKRYGDVPRVRCAPSQINQVLLNMLTNAAQAIEHDKGQIVLKTEHDGSWVRISIQDNGKGIAPENLKKVFDPFFTTKAIGQGTGLGLSISYQIVHAHGGTIQVASKVGIGTRFVVSLPVPAAAAATIAQPAVAAPAHNSWPAATGATGAPA